MNVKIDTSNGHTVHRTQTTPKNTRNTPNKNIQNMTISAKYSSNLNTGFVSLSDLDLHDFAGLEKPMAIVCPIAQRPNSLVVGPISGALYIQDWKEQGVAT